MATMNFCPHCPLIGFAIKTDATVCVPFLAGTSLWVGLGKPKKPTLGHLDQTLTVAFRKSTSCLVDGFGLAVWGLGVFPFYSKGLKSSQVCFGQSLKILRFGPQAALASVRPF